MAEKKTNVKRVEVRACNGCGDLLVAGQSCPSCKK